MVLAWWLWFGCGYLVDVWLFSFVGLFAGLFAWLICWLGFGFVGWGGGCLVVGSSLIVLFYLILFYVCVVDCGVYVRLL